MDQPNGKADKFKMQGERRTSRAVKYIRDIGRLSRRTLYEYTDGQVREMLDTLHAEIDEMGAKFSPHQKQQSVEPMFKFSE